MESFVFKYRKAIIGVGVFVLLLIIGISVWNIVWDRINSAKISVMVTPSIATVKIDGREYKGMEEYKIQPGEYTVEVSAEGFIAKTEKFVAVENETTNVFLYLLPTEENENWYKEHPEDALILGELENIEITNQLTKLREEFPILNQLPLEIDYYTKGYAKRVKYTISYRLNDEKTGFTIIITDYTGGNYEDALSKLKARGVNVGELEIKYIDSTADLEWGRAE